MTDVKPKRVLVYKRTHEDDPDPQEWVADIIRRPR
jgi:hypothetical protein